jgi:hypothetical protein
VEKVEQVEQIEISSLDLRYESYRMRHEGAEKALLCSISDYGIRDPLEGVDTGGDTRINTGQAQTGLTQRISGFCSMGSSACAVPGSWVSGWCLIARLERMRLWGLFT